MKPYNPESPALANCDAVWLKRRAQDGVTRFQVTQSRAYKRLFLVGLEGISSLDDLQPWFRSEVSVEMSSVPEPEEGELYHFEAIGLQVRTVEGDAVGKVVEVMALPANDVWVLESIGEGAPREILIPVVPEIVTQIDLGQGFAVIDPPLGLLDQE